MTEDEGGIFEHDGPGPTKLCLAQQNLPSSGSASSISRNFLSRVVDTFPRYCDALWRGLWKGGQNDIEDAKNTLYFQMRNVSKSNILP